jgi:hypothetical protein
MMGEAQANFSHSGQFSGTVKSDGFRKTLVVGVLKCPEALQSELRKTNVPTSGRFCGLEHTLWVNFRHSGQFMRTAKPDGFHKTCVVGVPECPEALQSELQNSYDVSKFQADLVGYSTRFGLILGTWANFWEPLNPMVFVKLMLLAFRNVQKRWNWSYGIHITSLRLGSFSRVIEHASGQF